MATVPAVQSALIEYAPAADELPPGWVIQRWDVSLDMDYWRRCIHARLGLLYLPKGTRAEIGLMFFEDRPREDYSWLHRFLVMAQEVPSTVNVSVDNPNIWP